MLKLVRTTSANEDFPKLIKVLDESIVIETGEVVTDEDNEVYDRLNTMGSIDTVVIAYDQDGVAVGSGCFRSYKGSKTVAELKRMVVLPDRRKQGIASIIMKELEGWMAEEGFKEILLETGDTMFSAIHCYKKNGYEVIDNYGEYADLEHSVCMRKFIG